MTGIKTFAPGARQSSRSYPHEILGTPRANQSSPPLTHSETHSGPVNLQLISRLWDPLVGRRHQFCPRWSHYAIIDTLLGACEQHAKQVGAPNLKRLTLVQRLLQSCQAPGKKVSLLPPQQVKEQEFFSSYLKHAERLHNGASTRSTPLGQHAAELLKAFCDWLLVLPKTKDESNIEEQSAFYRLGQRFDDFVHACQKERMQQLVAHSRQLREALETCDSETA